MPRAFLKGGPIWGAPNRTRLSRWVFFSPPSSRSDRFRHHGFVKEVIREGSAGGLELQLDPAVGHFFERLLNQSPNDKWEQVLRNKQLFGYGDYLGYITFSGNPDLLQRTQRQRALAEKNFTVSREWLRC